MVTLRGSYREPGSTDDAGFAMIFALAFVMMIGSFSLLLLSQLTSELSQTTFVRKHQQTVNIAFAGLNVSLNRIRNATLAGGQGVTANLPCQIGSNKGTLTGVLDPLGTQSWSVNIYYLATDPGGMAPAQVAAQALPCPLAVVPSYAYLLSTGSVLATTGPSSTLGNRTVHGTYVFDTSSSSGLGGQITYGNTCWDAGSSPTIGSVVTFQACQAPGTPAQNWYYRPDLSLQWAGDRLRNLFLDYRGLASATRAPVTLQLCAGLGIFGTAYVSLLHTFLLPGQQYQELTTNHSAWTNVTTAGYDGSSCLNSYGPASGTGAGNIGDQLVMGSTCSGGAASSNPAPTVGAGASSGTTGVPSPTQQLISLLYYGNCLDVAGSSPANGLITYPCHEEPDLTKIDANQQFQYNSVGSLLPVLGSLFRGTITSSRVGYYSTVCAQSNGIQVSLVTCIPGQAAQVWQMTGVIPGQYPGSYRIQDYLGNCLTADLPNPGNFNVGNIELAACSGSASQKWNAPPGGAQSLLKDVGE